MKKTLLCTLFIMMGLIILTGCGKKDLSNYAGTYELEYEKYVGDQEEDKNVEEWTIILNSDGTGTSNRNDTSYNVEWSIDGEEVKLTEKFAGIKIDYNGTLKNDKLDIINGDKTNDIILEIVFNKK